MSRPTIQRDSVIRASPRQVSTQLGTETVILGVERGQYFSLNEVGAAIWELIQDPRTVEAVCSELLSHYDVTRETLEADVLEILETMHAQGLVQVQLT
jgi:hypothetical protein